MDSSSALIFQVDHHLQGNKILGIYLFFLQENHLRPFGIVQANLKWSQEYL